MKTELTFTIGAKQAARQEGAFTVPSGCGQLCLKYDLSMEYTFLVFLQLKDPDGKVRFLKQLGYSEPVISIGNGAGDTTIGGVPGKIPAGRWRATVFLFTEHLERIAGGQEIVFHIEASDAKAEATECIGGEIWTASEFRYDRYDFDRIFCGEKRWYKGDLHTHTRLSDGKETPEEASRKAELMGLDFYAPTEHNTLHTGWPSTEVLILPGVEITTILGHANLFGVDRIPEALEEILTDKDPEKLAEDLLKIKEECADRGWLFSINHPFLYIWKWLFREFPLADVHCLEINNDPTYEADTKAQAEQANKKAVFLADLLWEDGYRICAVGGSDSHNKTQDFYPGAFEPSIPGDPATYLYMETLSAAHILEAIRGCRAYVARHCRIHTDLPFGEILPDTAKELSYTLELDGQIRKPDIFYIHNGKKYSCEVLWLRENCWQAKGTISLTEESYQWIRFGAGDRENKFLFYGNAITRGKKEHSLHTFGEAAVELERRWKEI